MPGNLLKACEKISNSLRSDSEIFSHNADSQALTFSKTPANAPGHILRLALIKYGLKDKNIKTKKTPTDVDVLRAIDGARTRGLDLGKVARYQLRHYRISEIVTEKYLPQRQNIYYYKSVGLSNVFLLFLEKNYNMR